MATTKRLICKSEDLVEGGAGVRFEVEGNGQPLPAFVVRYDGKVYGYLNQCAHVPIELDWMEGQFFDEQGLYLICSTHGAVYEPDSGHCVGGPCAGKQLVALPILEEAGQIVYSDESFSGLMS